MQAYNPWLGEEIGVGSLAFHGTEGQQGLVIYWLGVENIFDNGIQLSYDERGAVFFYMCG